MRNDLSFAGLSAPFYFSLVSAEAAVCVILKSVGDAHQLVDLILN